MALFNRFSPLASVAVLAAALGAAAPATAQAQVQPAAAASRWALPPAHVAMRSAILGGTSRMEQVLISQRSITPIMRSATPTALPAVAGLPNVFGSVALAVSRTPLDAQWRRASAAAPVGRWTAGFAPLRADNRELLLGEVNRWVNARIAFTDDTRLHGEADRWSGAAETLRRGRGDCEDYALTKMQMLAALGFADDDMFLVVARDTLRQGDHAVLVVRLDDRFLVLDNLNDAMIDASALSDYRPMFSYSSAGRWVHGFPIEPGRAIQVASGTTRTSR